MGLAEYAALEAAATELAVFPNPAEHQLNIAIPELLQGSTVQLMDATGRVVLAQQHVRSSMVSWSVDQLPAGMYLLSLRSSDFVTHKKLIIK